MYILQYLNSKGYNVSNKIYQQIDKWEDWYKGYVEDFHQYTTYNGIAVTTHDKFYLGMAKTISEDWASLLMNEKVKISTDSEPFNNILEEVFSYNNFRVQSNRLVELAFALGTGAFVEYLDSSEKVVIDFIRADMIYPISWENGYINECAFGSMKEFNGKEIMYVQFHLLENGKYIIQNKFVDADTGNEIQNDNVAEIICTGSTEPLFQIIMPNIINTVDFDSPLGISVFANAIQQLQGCDIIYDSYINEFNLGKKRIIVPLDMARIQMTTDGTMQPAFDNRDVAFYAMDMGENSQLKEIDMTLRAAEHDTAMQKVLDILGLKCGMGSGRYRFDNGTVKTATEIISAESKLYQTIRKHELVLEYALQKLAMSIGYLMGYTVKEVKVDFDDSIIIDKDAERKQDMTDVAMGTLTPAEYRAKWRNETLEEAEKMIVGDVV